MKSGQGMRYGGQDVEYWGLVYLNLWQYWSGCGVPHPSCLFFLIRYVYNMYENIILTKF